MKYCHKEKLLREIYYSPKAGLMSVKKIFDKVKKHGITIKQVVTFLKRQRLYQIVTQSIGKPFMPIIPKRGQYFADLMFLQDLETFNNGYGVLLCIINAISRKGFVYPLKNKKTSSVCAAFEQFFDGNHDMLTLTTDNGTEFMSHRFQNLLQKNRVTHHKAVPGDHHRLGLIERFNQTVRRLINNYLIAYETNKYIDVLHMLIHNYNNTNHSTTNTTPNDVTLEIEKKIVVEAYKRAYKAIKLFRMYRVGDVVRVLVPKGLFEKGRAQYSKKTYKIKRIEGFAIYVSDENDNELEKPHKYYELQKVGTVEEAHKKNEHSEAVDVERKEAKEQIRQNRKMKKEGIEEVPYIERSKRSRPPSEKLILSAAYS